VIVHLDWDSAHFGFPVARAEPAGAPAAALEADLEKARADGVRLVYHHRPMDDPLDAAVLERHGGRALTATVYYDKPLDVGRRPVPEGLEVETVTELSDRLRALAPLSGHYSRFRVDPGIPEAAFVSLYEIWLERSIAGEMAERVLSVGDASGPELGFVTIVRSDAETGRLGLMSVRPDIRGKGLATGLVAAAEAAMEAAGASRTEVWTHVENTAAIGLFERFGYARGHAERAHHFWLEPPA
jgi:dTDP-4-amino-4,6-dideoxy-D-galactose acyltransferase